MKYKYAIYSHRAPTNFRKITLTKKILLLIVNIFLRKLILILNGFAKHANLNAVFAEKYFFFTVFVELTRHGS